MPTPGRSHAWDVAPVALLQLAADGTILDANRMFLEWVGRAPQDVLGGTRLSELLSVGGRIYWETHLSPLLHMQGRIDEVAVELRGPDGRLPVLLSARARSFDDGAAVVDVALSRATERSRYERELLAARAAADTSAAQKASVAHELQLALLTTNLPTDDRFRVVTEYRPGVQALEVGGDWYDAFLVDDDVLALVVGDVVGRGLHAATAMGQLRSAVRAVAGPGVGPAALLERVDRFVERTAVGFMATIAYAEVALDTGRVRYACAGHLPPLRFPATGAHEFLWEGRSTPLGFGSGRVEAEVTLGPEDLLMLYTDGLVERRNRPLMAGLEVLADAGAAILGPSGSVRTLVTQLLDHAGDERDDVCALVMKWWGPDRDR
ncbi:PP2C family protein-serine/threonine phosphatase [Cellulomonas sp. ICMP 17802]|uniref:PP2C family protein-serine/threonine phosphatase n=1 Tax=Cellulomonas sp. ICMP 17802 TaxID=3239199 RepID=UPI00351B1383